MSVKKSKNLISVFVLLIIVIIILGAYQLIILREAHSTFDNYYNFRGCVKLISRTDDSGICQVSSGQTIKIVKFNNRWFLDGDLPGGFLFFLLRYNREPVKPSSPVLESSISQSLSTTTVNRSPEIFTNSTGHYSFEYPQKWQAAVNVYNNKNSLFGSGASGESGLGGVEITNYSGALKDYPDYQEKTADIRYITRQDAVINGFPAIRTEYQGSASGGFSVLLKDGDRIFNIYINSHDANDVKAFNQLASSFVIIK